MGVVFEVHNEFGRLLDEDLYKCEIATRCVTLGLHPAEREVRIRVRHESFIKDHFMELLADWGAFLDVNLYREALVHFLGGPSVVCRAVEVFSGSRRLGTQNLNLLNEDSGFALTTKPRDTGAMRDHLTRLLHHTRLKAIQWINLHRHLVEFTTLVKSKS
jgi:hypothetical protein